LRQANRPLHEPTELGQVQGALEEVRRSCARELTASIRLQADGIGVRESDLQLYDAEALETVPRARKGGMPEHCQWGKLSVLWVSMRRPARRMRKVPGILDATVPPRRGTCQKRFHSGLEQATGLLW
jgi:hypothetical protein